MTVKLDSIFFLNRYYPVLQKKKGGLCLNKAGGMHGWYGFWPVCFVCFSDHFKFTDPIMVSKFKIERE